MRADFRRIILGCLVIIGFIAGGIKLHMNKQRSVVCNMCMDFAEGFLG